MIIDDNGMCILTDEDMSYHTKNAKHTNADRIRSMTDDELAMLLQPTCPSNVCKDEPPQDCYKCWLQWLQQEVE